METLTDQSYVLVYYDERKNWLVRPKDTPKLHTHIGILNLSDYIGKQFGIAAVTSKGKQVYLLKPRIEDYILKFSRKTQIIYPKDLSFIVLKCSIGSGSRVLEAGTGSGATTAYLSFIVGKEGHVYSYEVRKEFQEIARKNLEKANLLGNVTLLNGDIKQKPDVDNLDAAIIDIPDPWLALESVKSVLKKSSVAAFVTPTVNQAEKLVLRMKELNFARIETFEILMRKIDVKQNATRPYSIMIGHTAYVTFGTNT